MNMREYAEAVKVISGRHADQVSDITGRFAKELAMTGEEFAVQMREAASLFLGDDNEPASAENTENVTAWYRSQMTRHAER